MEKVKVRDFFYVQDFFYVGDFFYQSDFFYVWDFFYQSDFFYVRDPEQNTSYGLILRQDTCSCDVEPWKRVYGGRNLSKISRKWFSKNSCWHEKKIHANMKKKFMTWKKNSCHEIADVQPHLLAFYTTSPHRKRLTSKCRRPI